MACEVYVSAPPASSATVAAGQRAQVKVPGQRTHEVALDTGVSADTPVRNQGPGRSLPGPNAGHPLQAAANGASPRNTRPRATRQSYEESTTDTRAYSRSCHPDRRPNKPPPKEA
jgi:hypothetical protein